MKSAVFIALMATCQAINNMTPIVQAEPDTPDTPATPVTQCTEE